METTDEWRNEVERLGRAGFVARHRNLFLLEHIPVSSAPGAFEFETATMSIEDADKDEMPAAAPPRRIAALVKRKGNPFPDRISVGRALNCDIVIRETFISKLHAHFYVEKDGSFRLVDNRSANGTWHNRRRLDADERVKPELGDELGFGALRLRLLDAANLFDALVRR